MESVLLDAAGHRHSPATMPGYHRRRPPRNTGEEYPADPPTVEEIVAVMPAVGDRPDGHRLRALIVPLWRTGLRISEALALQESDLDHGRGAVLSGAGRAASVVRSRWTAGHGISSTRGLRSAASFRSARCCVSFTAPPPADAGKRRPRASSCITRPPRLTSAAGSRRTSYGTRPRSR
jgi:integrase